MTIRINLLWIFLCSRFVCSEEKNATIVRIETIRNLQAGEEITICYSENYFDDNNKNCRCFSCRAQQYIESEECPKSLPNFFGSSTPTHFAISPASTPSTNSDQETEGCEELGNSGELCNGEEPCNSEELSEPKHDQGETEELKSHKREKKVKTDLVRVSQCCRPNGSTYTAALRYFGQKITKFQFGLLPNKKCH